MIGALRAAALLGLLWAVLPAVGHAAEREIWRERGGPTLSSRRAPGFRHAMPWHGRPSLYHRNRTYYPSYRAGSR